MYKNIHIYIYIYTAYQHVDIKILNIKYRSTEYQFNYSTASGSDRKGVLEVVTKIGRNRGIANSRQRRANARHLLFERTARVAYDAH